MYLFKVIHKDKSFKKGWGENLYSFALFLWVNNSTKIERYGVLMKINHSEVKVIACDIDGTLLPYGASAISDEIFELIDQLTEKGIHFLIASGRGEESIRDLFAPVQNKIEYVCANGAIYIEKDELIFTQPFERSEINGILNDFKKDTNLTPVIMCADQFYIILSGDEKEKKLKREFLREAVLENIIEVEGPEEIPQEICKLGVYQREIMNAKELSSYKHRWPHAIMVSGGGNWLDVTYRGTNKGSALKKILHRKGMTPDNLMTFGDNENDTEMLQIAKYGFAVKNAVQVAKEAATYECENVASILRKLV